MKILEIINTDMRHGNREDRLDLMSLQKKKQLGTGKFASVYKGDDIEVTKVEFDEGRASPYDVYVRAIIDNNLSSKNPYFPRIYARRTFDGTNQIEYEMEELIPLDKFLEENPEYVEYFSDKIFDERTTDRMDGSVDDFLNTIDSIHIRGPQYGGDKLYNQAIDIIRGLRDRSLKMDSSGPVHFDLHSANYMVRLTNTGPQLVITDPLS